MFKITTLTHINDDTSKPLISLTTRLGNKYLFGKIPEGTQRILNSINSEIKYNKLQGIFISGAILSWSDIGGLPGLFLTISDATKQGVKIFGNSKILSYIVTTWRQFVFRLGINLDIIDVVDENQEIILSNDEISVKSIQIEPTNFNNSLEDSPISDNNNNILFRQLKKLASLMFPLDTSEVNSRNPESYKSDPSQKDIHTHVKLPRSKISQYFQTNKQNSISYLIEFAKIRGKFDPQRAKNLGLKPGLQFRDLTNGQSVINEKGEIIEPHQVLGPDKILPKILIIDIPSYEYYENTITNNNWFNIENLGLIYHFIGDDINFNLQSYIETFLNKFSPNVKHVISHKSITNNIIMNDKFDSNQLKLKLIMNENINLLNSENYKDLKIEENIERLHSLQAFGLNEKGIMTNNSQVIKASSEDIFNTEIVNSNDSNVLEILSNLSFEDLQNSKFKLDDDNIDIEKLTNSVHLCTLGTGSALPSINRNVLSNLVRIPYQTETGEIIYRSVLLDCGENTIGSLLRNFGHNHHQDFIKIFKELKLIYISHLHADHHLGICSIINKWFEINTNENENLYLILPWQFITFLKDWYIFESNYNHNFNLSRLKMFSLEEFLTIEARQAEYSKISIDEFEKLYDSSKLKNEIISKREINNVDIKRVNEMYESLGIRSINSVRALHCPWSYSTTFDFSLNFNNSQFFKISFSGDTRPNYKFVKIGSNSDLLIHESSLDLYWLDEAIAKKHSTSIESIWISKLMNCSNLILTHFSTRYGMSNNYISKDELVKESKFLQNQLNNKKIYNIIKNIDLEDSSNTKFDLNILYAYDLMNIRFRNLKNQENYWNQFLKIFEINSKKRKLANDDDNDDCINDL
ncbi:hypothetical protein KGF54_002542 [Candida jiufengensis]|uniref:uncharacterized protein n=1 Tax=Candida jiufengensis TaxID=497108 RepID=UPI0022240FE6|nr:uncharacterized protein KGF54_002542 [Candida jiufengensis]KAI5953171.1 hypothetical protein KGF54_002542 [Candida jiufengensis]